MYQVALLNFEGPLDLLLQLIERSDMEITEVSLSDITTQYLQYIAVLPALGAGELNQFLELASRLIYLKSVALLPLEPSSVLSEEMADLTEQLAQYRKYQSASRYLEQLIRNGGRTWTREVTSSLPPSKIPFPNISPAQLQDVFNKALVNLPEESVIAPTRHQTITMAEMTALIMAWLSQQNPAASLSRFIEGLTSRSELVVAFMALLELIRQQTIRVSQDSVFGDIMIARSGSKA